ncbi:MAG: helix-turn-helix domain-containing protein [Oscillospiraceae bacterium]
MKSHNVAKYRDEYIQIGLKIGYLRKQRGMTQEQLAEKASISMGFLSQIEASAMATGFSLATLFSIAEALQVPASKLLEFDF